MIEFVENSMQYLGQYHQRSNSESGFAAEGKIFWWNIG
jgi:transposase